MNYLEWETKIYALNSYNWDSLYFDTIFKVNRRAMFDRIVTKHIYVKYASYFAGNPVYTETYLENVFQCIQKCILEPEKLQVKDIETLYIQLFSFLHIPGYRNRKHFDVQVINHKQYTHSQYIQREMGVVLIQFNAKKQGNPLQDIYMLCIEKILATIHPFPDNNFLFTSLLIDILLIKNKLLPVEYKNSVQEYNIPDERLHTEKKQETFFEIVQKKYENYHF